MNQDIARSESAGVEVQAGKTFLEKHRVAIGVEERYDFRLVQENFDVEPRATYLDSRERGSFFSIYAQDEFRIAKNLILNGGIRYDHFSTFGGTLNPRAALIYQPAEATTLKAVYGQAFRAPNAYENFYESSINKRNPRLSPETIRSYELIWEQQLGKHWRTSTSLVLDDIKGLIGYSQDPSDNLYYFDNLDSVRNKGAEVEVEGQWGNGFRGRASYSHALTEELETGMRLSNSPAHLGKLSLSLPLWGDKLFASAELQAMSRRRTVRGDAVGGALVANATLFSQNLVKGLEVSASVYNLFDERFRDPVASDFTQDSIEQDGRTFRVKLTHRF